MVSKQIKGLIQPQNGYRYNIDSFLLVRFAKINEQDRICDLGAGVGVMGLLAIQHYGVKEVVAVEIQKELAGLAKKNAETFQLTEQFKVLQMNWKQIDTKLSAKSFDVVISNPPYRKLTTGKLPPLSSKAIAKHEIEGSLSDLLKAANHLLNPAGRLYLIYPPIRLEELIHEISHFKMKLQRMALIHPYSSQPATQVMFEVVKSCRRELTVEAPVVIYEKPNKYRPEIEAWVGTKQKL